MKTINYLINILRLILLVSS